MSFSSHAKNFFYAYAMLAGTTIGVGIFTLPYITSQAGFLTVAAYFLFLGAVAMLVHIFWGEEITKTKGHHRLPGIVKIYLGSFWGRVSKITAIGSLFGAIMAYVTLGADFFHSLFGGYAGGDAWLYVILSCLLGAFLVWRGGKIIAKLEVWGIIILALVFAVLIWRTNGHFQIENFFLLKGQVKNFFLPYGVVLFSLWGISAVPEIGDVLGRDKKMLNKIIIVSALTAMAVYFLFIIIILGVSGTNVDPTALGGLSGIMGEELGKILLTLGILTTFTSYITLTLALNKLLVYDLKIGRLVAMVTVAVIPMVLYFLGVNNFIMIISFVGSVLLAIDGIFIASVYTKLGRLSVFRHFAVIVIIVCFVLGIFYEFYKIL